MLKESGRRTSSRGEAALLFLAGRGRGVATRGAVKRHLLQAGVTQASKIPESMRHNQSLNYENGSQKRGSLKCVVKYKQY